MASLTLGSVEAVVRLALEPPGLYPKPQENAILAVHSTRGYALRPGAIGHYVAGGHRAAIHINRRGFRDGSYESAHSAQLRILAVGDSFTMGLGVDSTDPWPQQLETLLSRRLKTRVRVVNAGVPGYSARQMRQVIDELSLELRPHAVVFALNSETYWRVEEPYVYHGGQLVRTSVLPSVVEGRRGLYYSPFEHRPWLRALDMWMNRHFETGAHFLALAARTYGGISGHAAERHSRAGELASPDTVQARSMLEPALGEILKARTAAEMSHSRFAVLLVNPQGPNGSFDETQYTYNKVVTAFCREHGITVVDPLRTFAQQARGVARFRSPDDYHWTRAAHAVAAAEVATSLAATLCNDADVVRVLHESSRGYCEAGAAGMRAP